MDQLTAPRAIRQAVARKARGGRRDLLGVLDLHAEVVQAGRNALRTALALKQHL